MVTIVIYCICIAELQTICKEYWNRIFKLEGDKFDLEHIEKVKAQEVNCQWCATIASHQIALNCTVRSQIARLSLPPQTKIKQNQKQSKKQDFIQSFNNKHNKLAQLTLKVTKSLHFDNSYFKQAWSVKR